MGGTWFGQGLKCWDSSVDVFKYVDSNIVLCLMSDQVLVYVDVPGKVCDRACA